MNPQENGDSTTNVGLEMWHDGSFTNDRSNEKNATTSTTVTGSTQSIPTSVRKTETNPKGDDKHNKYGIEGRSCDANISSFRASEQSQRQRGPHPSQIRVSSPNHETASPQFVSAVSCDNLPQHQDKPVVLRLQSSMLKYKVPSGNGITLHTGTSITTSTSTAKSNGTGTTTATRPGVNNAHYTVKNVSLTSSSSGHHPPTPSSPSPSLLHLPFLNASPLNSLQQLLALPSLQQPNQQQTFNDCDYDQSPTELYRLIEQKQWKRILQKFEEAENDDDDENDTSDVVNSSMNDAISATESAENRHISQHIQKQSAMWIVRKESNGRLKWRILPLHAAIIFRAPHFVIEAIVQSYPMAASQKDDQGMLPLHLAMKNFNLEYNNVGMLTTNVSSTSLQISNSMQQLVDTVTCLWATVEELLVAYPSGIFGRDRKGRTPLQIGIQTIKKSYHQYDANSNNHSSSRHVTVLRLQQQQEMMRAALSVLQQYEKIYSAANDRGNVRRQTSPSEYLQQQQSTTVPQQPLNHESTDETQEQQTNQNLPADASVLSLQQHHLETLKHLRTMFLKHHNDVLANQQHQQEVLKQQLNDSRHRERQLQLELDNVRREMQDQQQQ